MVSAEEVVLNVSLLQGAEETAAPKASVLELPPEGQRAQARLREGLAHGPAARLLGRSPGQAKSAPGTQGLGLPDPSSVRVRRSPAAADMVELLNALVDEGRRCLLVGHRHATTEEHLELLGERVVKLGWAVQLLLTCDLAGLADGADDLRHLQTEGAGLLRRAHGARGLHITARRARGGTCVQHPRLRRDAGADKLRGWPKSTQQPGN